MLARRVIALSADKAFGKLIATSLRASGGVVELHPSLDGLGRGDVHAALVVVHLAGELASCAEELTARLGPDTRMIAILPTPQLDKTVDVMKASDKIAGILVQSDFRAHDLSAMATRILAGDIFGLEKLVPWGTRVYSTLVADYQEKSLCIAQISEFAELMGVRRKYREAVEQCVDEMLMNALYDAPVDDQGKQIFADIPTKSRIQLRMEQKVVVQYACDAHTFTVSVRDSYGTIDRPTVLRYLWKCLHSEQQIDRKTGGAGLGLYLIANSSTRFIFNVLPGVATECVCAFDLDTPKVQLDAFGFFTEKIDASGRLAAGPSRLLPHGASHPVERRGTPGTEGRGQKGVVGALSAAIVLLIALIGLVAYPRFISTPRTSVAITTDPAGATIEIDGHDRGVAAAGALTVGGLEIGRAYRVVARLDGHGPAETVFQPASGPPTNLALRLVPRSATVLLDSDPRGATIVIAGAEAGVTPLTLTSLAPGAEVPVTFRAAGYQETTRTMRVPAPGGESQVMQAMTMSRDYATLAVTSEPPGAEVALDGRRLPGALTPTSEILVEAGKRHVVGARLAGHAPATVAVTPTAGTRAVPVKLVLQPGGALSVRANLEARLTVEGVPACSKQPLPFDCALKAGTYTVDIETIKLPGTARRVVQVTSEGAAVAFELGWVEAPDGLVIVVGKRRGRKAAFEVGKRTVTVSDDGGSETYDVEVKIAAGKPVPLP